MIIDPNDDPIQAAIKKAKAEMASEQAAQAQQNMRPSNPRLPSFASESTGASTQPRKPGDIGAIDPLGMAANVYQGATMNWGDEAAGVVGGAIGKLQGKPFAEGYDVTRGAVNRTADTYAGNHPGMAAGAQIVGAAGTMLLSGGASTAGKGAATLSQLARTGATAGAKFGGIAGAGAGDGVFDRTGKAIGGAIMGGAVGAALPTAVAGATRAPGAMATKAAETLGATNPVSRGLAGLARGADAVTQRAGNAVNRWWQGDAAVAGGDAAAAIEVPVLPVRQRQALDALASRQADPATMRAANAANMADNSPEMLATLLPANAQRTVRAADALSENGATRTALDSRIKQQGPNLAAKMDGPTITPSVDGPAFKQQAQAASGDLFEIANRQPPVVAPEINEVLETPFGRRLYNQARERASNDLQWRADLPSAEELAARPAQAANEAFIRTMHGKSAPPPIPEQLPTHIAEAVNRTVKQLADDGVEVTDAIRQQITGATLAADDAAQAAKATFEPKALHWMKIAADDAYEQATTNSERMMADQYRRRLLSVLGDESRIPEMSKALRAYEGPMAQADAMQTAFSGDGTRSLPGVLNAQPRAVRAELSNLASGRNQLAADTYRNSGKQMVRDYLGKIRPDRDVTKTLFPDGPKDELVQALLSEAEAGKFGRQLSREQSVGQARDNILGNSSTARNQADLQLLNQQANSGMLPLSQRGTSFSEDVVRSGSLRQPIKARIADALQNRRLAKTRAVADEIDRVGALSGDELAPLLELWAQRQQTVYQPLGMAARATGRVAGSTQR